MQNVTVCLLVCGWKLCAVNVMGVSVKITEINIDVDLSGFASGNRASESHFQKLWSRIRNVFHVLRLWVSV